MPSDAKRVVNVKMTRENKRVAHAKRETRMLVGICMNCAARREAYISLRGFYSLVP